MAVQKNRMSRAKRDTRRAHDGLGSPTLATDPVTGALHRRHHMTKDGYFRGRQVIAPKVEADDNDED